MRKFVPGIWQSGVSNSYYGSKGKLKRICRTNGWHWTGRRNNYGTYDITCKGMFRGHYSEEENKMYILFMK